MPSSMTSPSAIVLGRLAAVADAFGRAGGDDVAGQQAHELAEVADQGGDVEDEVRRVGVLARDVVAFEPEVQVVRIFDFVGRGEEGAEGREGVAAFAFDPLAAAFELPFALAVVVVEAVAGDVIHGVGLADIGGFFADDDGEFDFPIALAGVFRDDDGVVGADDGGGRFEEDDGLLRASMLLSLACLA